MGSIPRAAGVQRMDANPRVETTRPYPQDPMETQQTGINPGVLAHSGRMLISGLVVRSKYVIIRGLSICSRWMLVQGLLAHNGHMLIRGLVVCSGRILIRWLLAHTLKIKSNMHCYWLQIKSLKAVILGLRS